QWQDQPTAPLLRWWWFAWIGGFIVNTAYRSAWKSAHDVSSLSEATVIGMGSEALDILAFSLALVLVTRLYQMQHSVATLSARHDDEAASVSASKTETQWRAAEIFLFGFVGAASLVVILLYATWPTQRSCPRPWCRSGYPEQRWLPDQAATVGRVTMGASLRGAMVS